MNILLDASLPPRLARALNILVQPEHTATHTRDVIGNDASDCMVRDYLEQHPHSLVIAMDLDLAEHPHRLAALREWSRPVFLLSAAWLEEKPWSLNWMLVHRLPGILAKAGADVAPSVYLVPPPRRGNIRNLA